jgi:acyl-CoA synthetase (AMP-forming)/AMP-acid ligase II
VPGAEPTLEDLVAFTRGRLGGFKQPRRLVLVDSLPVNAAGKVLKRELREQVTADA